MAEYSKIQVLEKVQQGEGLERSDLSQIELDNVTLDKVNMARADLESANLNGSSLKKANLSSASLRDASLIGANLEGANLRNADLEGCNLSKAVLRGADLSRANMEGVNLEEADLTGARMQNAVLTDANLGKATLGQAQLRNADFQSAYLGGAKMIGADLQKASLENANLEEADLSSAQMKEANLVSANCEGTQFESTGLYGADFSGSQCAKANFARADLRKTKMTGVAFLDTIMTGALIFEMDVESEALGGVFAEWVDGSTKGDGTERVNGTDLIAFFERKLVPATAAIEPGVRFFGRGDVLRNADLEFDTGSIVEIESTFRQCKIKLGDNAQLTVGQYGLLENCHIEGMGIISIDGMIKNSKKITIDFPKIFKVGSKGRVFSSVLQSRDYTQFAFEPGCTLKMKIGFKK